MRVIVTGGAGFIGSHVARLIDRRGDVPIIVDDFVTGLRERVSDYPAYDLDLSSPDAVGKLVSVIERERATSVIHLAALKRVDESVQEPLKYMGRNLTALAHVLQAMAESGLRDLVFSSSAAVYGEQSGVVAEDAALAPISPYGRSKLAGEWLCAAEAGSSGLRAVSLRYFNVAGTGWPDLQDTVPLNLIPIALERLSRHQPVTVFGDDYPTIDGTCVRDFVHVLDVAEAHLAVLDTLEAQTVPHRAFNIGTGTGTSVRQVVDGLRAELGGLGSVIVADRRPGDVADVVADVRLIAREIGWRAQRDVDEILRSVVKAVVFKR